MTQPLFTGVGVALVTLFDESGEVDAPATGRLAAELVAAGLRSVVVTGTTGEAFALTPEERVAVVAAVRDAVPAGTPVVAGTGAPSGRTASLLTRQALDAGADAVLVLSPHGVEDPRPYFEQVVGAADGGHVMAYHFPAVAAPGIPVEVLTELAGHGISGVKDSSGDPERLLREVVETGLPVYAGSSAVLVQAGATGAAGAILTMANAEPELCVRAFDGDGDAQRELLTSHLVGTRDLPDGIKALTAKRFGTSTVARVGR
jgi:4-hydroxy-tetrahydrodipicolinate synthase